MNKKQNKTKLDHQDIIKYLEKKEFKTTIKI